MKSAFVQHFPHRVQALVIDTFQAGRLIRLSSGQPMKKMRVAFASHSEEMSLVNAVPKARSGIAGV
jgi:hypothetical protein